MSPKTCLKFGFDLEQATVVCCIVEFFFAYVHLLVACFVVLLAPLRYFSILGKPCYGHVKGDAPPKFETEKEQKEYGGCMAAFAVAEPGDLNPFSDKTVPGLTILQWIFLAVYVVYFLGLLVQAGFSIPLYLIGYKKKNIKIVTAWIIIATINYICPGILFVGSFCGEDLGGAYSPPTTKEEADEDKSSKWMRGTPGGIPKLTGFLFIYMFYLDFPAPVFWAFRKHLKQGGGGNIAPASIPQQAMQAVGMQPAEASEVQVFSDDPAGGEGEAENV